MSSPTHADRRRRNRRATAIARKALKSENRDAGFTLIELLVVIIIIGILAAIAIPVFLNQRKKAVDAGIESDLKNAATATESYSVDFPAATVITLDDLFANGFRVTEGNQISVSGSPAVGYCLTGYNPDGARYTTAEDPLTYDSLAGGLGQAGSACTVWPIGDPVTLPSCAWDRVRVWATADLRGTDGTGNQYYSFPVGPNTVCESDWPNWDQAAADAERARVASVSQGDRSTTWSPGMQGNSLTVIVWSLRTAYDPDTGTYGPDVAEADARLNVVAALEAQGFTVT